MNARTAKNRYKTVRKGKQCWANYITKTITKTLKMAAQLILLLAPLVLLTVLL